MRIKELSGILTRQKMTGSITSIQKEMCILILNPTLLAAIIPNVTVMVAYFFKLMMMVYIWMKATKQRAIIHTKTALKN